jgi:hypothetical protein
MEDIRPYYTEEEEREEEQDREYEFSSEDEVPFDIPRD